jgi:hypothetical protein
MANKMFQSRVSSGYIGITYNLKTDFKKRFCIYFKHYEVRRRFFGVVSGIFIDILRQNVTSQNDKKRAFLIFYFIYTKSTNSIQECSC